MEVSMNNVLSNNMPLAHKTDNIGNLNFPKYKSILCIGNLKYMCTKSFTDKQKENWLENFGVEIIDYKEGNNENN